MHMIWGGGDEGSLISFLSLFFSFFFLFNVHFSVFSGKNNAEV